MESSRARGRVGARRRKGGKLRRRGEFVEERKQNLLRELSQLLCAGHQQAGPSKAGHGAHGLGRIIHELNTSRKGIVLPPRNKTLIPIFFSQKGVTWVTLHQSLHKGSISCLYPRHRLHAPRVRTCRAVKRHWE